MSEMLSYSFMQYALAACFFTVVICAVAGTLAVVNRNVYITGGVAHASYGGIGLALWAGFAPVLGAMGVALVMGIVLGVMRLKNSDKTDAFVSALWAMGMAAGILLTDLTPGYPADYLSYLFGNILLVTKLDLIFCGVFSIAALVLAAIYYRAILAVSADQEYASTLGYNVRLINLVMLVLLCVAVVLLMRVAGLIMVMALLAIPASIAESYTKRLSLMMALAGGISAVCIFGGLFLAVKLNLTPSAVIVAFLSILYIINIVLTKKNVR